ncbi:MAG: glycosyltransferase [Methanothrix sp.]|nr:glycosyltransferase [Methanothrix sp.]
MRFSWGLCPPSPLCSPPTTSGSGGSVVLRARQYADRPRDDGSSDHTAEVASLAGAEVLRHVKKQGKGAALRTGFESLNGDAVIVTIDADGKLLAFNSIPQPYK